MKNQVEISQGNIADLKGDVVLNWTTSSFKSGPIDTFFPLLKKSGPQPLEAINTFLSNIKDGNLRPGDCISTIPGLLNYSLIIHSIISNDDVNNYYNLTWYNIVKTIKTYKSNNICRTVYVTIPSWKNKKDFILEFLKYFSSVPK